MWTVNGENDFVGYHRLFPTDAGDLYGAECYGRACALFHRGGSDWEYFSSPAFIFDVGRDGTVWRDGMLVEEDVVVPVEEAGEGLVRFTDGEWTGWTSDDLPDIRFGVGLDSQFEVAPDGSLWFSLWRSADPSHWRTGPRMSPALLVAEVTLTGLVCGDGDRRCSGRRGGPRAATRGGDGGA